jgi:3-methyladenine DNA glycosylase AlkD
MRAHAVIADLDKRIAKVANPTTATIRVVRKETSRALRSASREQVLEIANRLVERDTGNDRWIAYEIVAAHSATMESLSAPELKRLGAGMDSWQDVDTFASFLAGAAWREQKIRDEEIARWAKSKDIWWRRAAVVSTVPLNNKARGGHGDAPRTLAVCSIVLEDREPLVVKAVSWALRELAKRLPEEVRRFVSQNQARLAPVILREVSSKLTTGLKNPRRPLAQK